MRDATLTFHGGAGSVTGANFLLELEEKKILVDCGLVQGTKEQMKKNSEDFAYDPSSADVLFVTHSHIDHIGRIPKLVAAGFKGTIYSTKETRALAELMLEDAFSVMSYAAKKSGDPLLYEKKDIERALSLWKAEDYYKKITIGEEIHAELRDAGHILGSAMIEITVGSEKILFSGDLGPEGSLLLRDTDEVTDAKYVVMESVYGDRIHEDASMRREKLREIIKEVVEKKSVLLIPAFSLERTQVMLHELNHLVEEGEVPAVPVFLDSPLAIRVTSVYQAMQDNFNDSIKKESDDDLFGFPGFKMTESTEESKEINDVPGPKIVIAGAGMSHAGRIQYHEMQHLGDPDSILLLVGYQSPGSVGRRLMNGEKEISIFGKKVKVRARVEQLLSYSAHKDRDELLEFIEKDAEAADTIFVAMGELKSSAFLAQRIRDYLGAKAVAPQEGESFELVFNT